MGYNQNIQMKVMNRSKTRVYKIKNPWIGWGKFYNNPNKDQELNLDDPQLNNREIGPQDSHMIAACGRSDSSSGTEGSIEIWEGETKVGSIYWSNPWAPGAANTVSATTEGGDKSEYSIGIGPYSQGASVGYVEAKISHID